MGVAPRVIDCYEATVVVAKSSPFVYGLTDAGQVTSPILSFSVLTKTMALKNICAVSCFVSSTM